MGFQEDVDPRAAVKHPEGDRQPHVQCEKRGHVVRIPRHQWPPQQAPGRERDRIDRPHVSVRCEHCGAWLMVYDPPPPRVTVVLFGEQRQAGQVVEEEAGQVVDEAPPEPGGVVDEAEMPRRRRG